MHLYFVTVWPKIAWNSFRFFGRISSAFGSGWRPAFACPNYYIDTQWKGWWPTYVQIQFQFINNWGVSGPRNCVRCTMSESDSTTRWLWEAGETYILILNMFVNRIIASYERKWENASLWRSWCLYLSHIVLPLNNACICIVHIKDEKLARSRQTQNPSHSKCTTPNDGAFVHTFH